jgi:hypothetical protein
MMAGLVRETCMKPTDIPMKQVKSNGQKEFPTIKEKTMAL